MSETDPATLARSFIEDQERSAREDGRPSFWTMNHHRISPIAGKLAKVLEPDERIAFYRHYMQRSGGFPAVPQREIELLVEAYRRLLPQMDAGLSNHMETRHDSLYVFGFDETGTLPGGVLDSAATLKARLKTLTQIGKYTSLPAQRDKKDKFRPFTGEAPRLLETLRHLGYVHDRRWDGAQFSPVDLCLWGMILIVLLEKETRTELVRDLVDGLPDLPCRVEYLALLYKTVRAVREEAGPEESEFHRLAGALERQELARRETTQTMRLLRALDIDLADEFEWDISIAIAQAGSGRSPFLAPNLRMHLRPEPEFQWRLDVSHSEKGGYSQSPEKVYRNEAGVEPLPSLDALPDWLKRIAATNGLAFDVGNAEIKAGRKRQAAKRLGQWLRGET